jgi:hypothetical protein
VSAKFCTILVRRRGGVFTAAAGDVEITGLSATVAARSAGARVLGVQSHMVDVEVVDHGERGSTRQVLRVSVKQPARSIAWDYLVAAGICLLVAIIAYATWRVRQ